MLEFVVQVGNLWVFAQGRWEESREAFEGEKGPDISWGEEEGREDLGFGWWHRKGSCMYRGGKGSAIDCCFRWWKRVHDETRSRSTMAEPFRGLACFGAFACR